MESKAQGCAFTYPDYIQPQAGFVQLIFGLNLVIVHPILNKFRRP